jgi:N utilization substance protein B
MIGVYELQSRIDIPYRVVINEGVNLAKRFGAMDGHKYINACLDAAAQSLREIEVQAESSG